MNRKGHLLAYLLIFVALIGYVAYKARTSPEWRNFDFGQLRDTAAQLEWRYLLVTLALIYSTYLFRALRWREFLRPVKVASMENLLVGTIIGFGGLALLGRPGELVRPYIIAKKEDLSLTSQVAIWVLERIYDLAMVVVVVAASMLLWDQGAVTSASARQAQMVSSMETAGATILLLSAAGIAVLAAFRVYWRSWVPWLGRYMPARVRPRIEHMLAEFGQGLGSLRSARAFLLGVLYTAAVWACISVAYYFVLKAFGPPLSEFGFWTAVLIMGFAIAGSMLQVPGIGGGSQVFTIVALTEIFHIRAEIATSAAIVLWLATFVAVVPPALLMVFREGLSWRKLRTIAAAEEARL